jgi:hypothetical protein
MKLSHHLPVNIHLALFLFAIAICCHALPALASEDTSSGITTGSFMSPLPGLTIEEYALKSKPAGDVSKPFFEPLYGSEKEILKKHQKERNNHQIVGEQNKVQLGKDVLVVETYYEVEGKVGVKLFRNNKIIFTIPLGDNSPVEPIQGFWSYKSHWVLEVAHSHNREVKDRGSIYVFLDAIGEIIQDGKSLNKQHGYQESFNFQIMKDKPFYFFKKDDQIGISYDKKEVLLGYDEVPHYYCCEPSMLNPAASRNMVSFFARKNNEWYYVEIGIFK